MKPKRYEVTFIVGGDKDTAVIFAHSPKEAEEQVLIQGGRNMWGDYKAKVVKVEPFTGEEKGDKE